MEEETAMQALHQRELVSSDFPFRLFESGNLEFPPHWHEEIEMVYVLEGEIDVGVNNRLYKLNPKDILLIGGRDIHSFSSQNIQSKLVIIQFKLSLFDSLSSMFGDRRFVRPLLQHSRRLDKDPESTAHQRIENQILDMIQEYSGKLEGYRLALKARLYDLAVILLRQVPMENYPPREKSRLLNRLERLKKVFAYVEENYNRSISLEEVAEEASFSVYYFTRFFKEATGMTFGQYLSFYRINIAEEYLLSYNDPITEVAFKAGFNSIKTFNRVFKKLKGCSPTEFREQNMSRL